MAAFNFPNSPSDGDTHTENGFTYVWDGTNGAWKKNPASLSKGEKGEPGTSIKGDKGDNKGQKGEPGDVTAKGVKGDAGTKGDTGGGAPVGQIIAWSGAYNSLPSGYLICDGSAISRTTYAALFAVVGTTHGSGDGSTTFNLPDLQSKFITGASSDPNNSGYSVGAEGGANFVTLTVAQMPSHKHDTTFDNKKYFPGGGSTSVSYGGAGGYPADTFSMSNEGGGQAHENRPPYYALAYIIQYAQGGDVAKGQKGEPSTVKGQKGEPSTVKGQKGEPGATGSPTINNNADERVITGSNTSGELNAEEYMTWDGSGGNLVLDHTNGKLELAPGNGCIELTRTAGDAFIDFKNSKTDDFDIRIQQDGSSDKLKVYNYAQTGGDLEVTGNIINKAVPKAFVNFHGGTNTNGNCTMRDSYGVSSVGDLGAGYYRINWSSNFSNVNYTVTVSHSSNPNNGSTHGILYTTAYNVAYVDVMNHRDDYGPDRVDKDTVCVVARTNS